jgi:hypothetical protein
VYGDLDAVETIEEEAANADVVYHFANCDHEPSANAIAKGLARRQGDQPGYWIHTSGTLILGWETIELAEFGNRLDKVFDDWDNVKELTSHPDQAAHRNVSSLIRSAVERTDVASTFPGRQDCSGCIVGQGQDSDCMPPDNLGSRSRSRRKLPLSPKPDLSPRQ